MKKALSILLILAIAVSAFACAEKPTSADAETSAQTAEAVTEAETEPEKDKPDIAVTDYEGRIFNVVYPLWSLYKNFYFSEALTGDAVNDAIYKRSSTMEEMFNIDITDFAMDYIDKIYPEVSKTVMAGLPTYDLALLHNSTSLGSYVSDGIVMNFNALPNIDMTKDYWNQSVSANMELNGILPFASNNFIIPDVNSIFYNSSLAEQFGLGDVFGIVSEGKWTWDKMHELASAASADIDGDGKFTDADQYGFVGEIGWQFGSIATGADIYIISTDSEGEPYLSVNSERMYSLIEKVDRLVNDSSLTYTWAYTQAYDPNAGGTPPVSFNSGHALFYLVPLSLAPAFRDMDVDFGIIPLPKLDEVQESYTTLNWAGFMCVPLTVSDAEFAGTIIEYLGYFNRDIVMPAFYDILLGQKISRNEESIEMLDIIFNSSVYDLGVNIGLYSITNEIISSKSTDFASFYAKKEKSYQSTLDTYYKAHVKYAEDLGN